jgi:2-dehydro-3-deoxyphosphogluconate aldolase / (4S)-4-hydroxy-2-oxoglutarate aldolase
VTAVKLFPAGLGGVEYLRALRQPFPDVPLVPVGGVDADATAAYLRAGAVAVGVGSPLVGDAADGGAIAKLRGRAARFLAAAGQQPDITGTGRLARPRPGPNQAAQ